MNVKSIDIARALGISKSTVSLALNGKPGVSEQTRQEVLACKKQLEEHGVVPPGMFSRQPEQKKKTADQDCQNYKWNEKYTGELSWISGQM